MALGSVTNTVEQSPNLTKIIGEQENWRKGLAGGTTEILGDTLMKSVQDATAGRLQQQALSAASRGVSGSSGDLNAQAATRDAGLRAGIENARNVAVQREKMYGDSLSQAGQLEGERSNQELGQKGMGINQAQLGLQEQGLQNQMNLAQSQSENERAAREFQQKLATQQLAIQQQQAAQQQYAALIEAQRSSPTYPISPTYSGPPVGQMTPAYPTSSVGGWSSATQPRKTTTGGW